MFHENYFEIKADSYYDLGRQEGRLFGKYLIAAIEECRRRATWPKELKRARDFLPLTRSTFPNVIEELRGYAESAGAAFEDLWALSLEDEISDLEKCTTVVTNNGKLVAHNEDWEPEWMNNIYVLKKTVRDLTIFEFFYHNSFGASSISINSHGFIQAINTLHHTDRRAAGIPRNVIARWLSETGDPEGDFRKLRALPRTSGYNHTFVNAGGEIMNIESSATRQVMSRVSSPFVHTNHYLTELKKFEHADNSTGTFTRYRYAADKVKKSMPLQEMKDLMSNESKGAKASIFNRLTIGRMIIETEKAKAHVWLLREKEKGWVEYKLDFLRS
jgi:hypothetical protein